ncbi:MAG TPA: PaaI family thioesterase [Ktedonobacterales bacterium]|nr:PaaI family thioesterase [Ktedonobacterales bacterium]
MNAIDDTDDDTNEQERTRTYRWQDPMATAAKFAAQGGLEVLRRVVAGEEPLAPIMATMNFTLVEVEKGRAVFATTPAEYHYNPIGVVHGGVAATLLDSAMGCAINAALPAGTAYTTLEIKVNYLRPLTMTTGPVRAEGKVVHLGRRMAVAEGRITDASGKLYATASTTCLVMAPDATAK